MPPRNPELPEGTDHIINGAMETNAGTGASSSAGTTGGLAGGSGGGLGASGAGTGGLGTGGGGSSGFIGGGDTSVLGDDTGGMASGGNFGQSGRSGGNQGGKAVDQLKGGAQNLKQQATSKVREYAVDGKGRATSALSDFSNVIRESADSIDEKIGSEYGQYARRAADAVSDFADSIRNKDVDELYEDARSVVRKSPVVAIGAAAAVGFALVRLIKSGMPTEERDVEFTPDANLGTGASFESSGGFDSTGSSGSQSKAPYVAPTTGV